MTNTKSYVTVDERDINLDRADIHRKSRIELPQKSPDSSNDHRENQDEEEKRNKSTLHRVRVSVSEKKHDTAVKIKKTLHISKEAGTGSRIIDDDLQNDASALANPVPQKSDSRLKEKLPVPEKATVKDFLHNPIDITKKKLNDRGNSEAAANLAAKEISHGQEVDLLHAHDQLQNASTDAEKKEMTETFGELMKERQNMFVRWTADRHITKVRILPKTTFVRKSMQEFMRKDPGGNVAMDWQAYVQHLLEYSAQQYGGQYIGAGMDHPKPSKKTIMPNIERLVVASAPFQEFIMTTRRVYRWENRLETLKYLMVYTALWYMNLVFPGILSVVVYLVIHRQCSPKTMENLRQDIERTEDRHQTALTLTEFIEKEGSEEWADKIIETVGPWLMIQLADMANLFEVMRNFYEWRVPNRTLATLFILIFVILVSTFVPAWLFIRGLTFSAGVTFFGLFPISANLPEYRLLASIPKRLFWDIPTHGEWAIKAIQAEATRYAESRPLSPSSPFKSQDHDYSSYTATHNSTSGHLIISQSFLRFVSPTTTMCRILYTRLDRVEKVDRVVDKNIPFKGRGHNGKDLKIVELMAGTREERREWLFENMAERDQAFTQVLGFGGGVWQIVW
ncbi:unnamed protein product [Periconia digitata]|uniref:Uncharacterized protein n=1 Tax=Periconia digitata TaxID=1303443 RepID=A0A9W4U3E8_9PLEO|nr:unnamed protein product [Periconia digitata]